jgi:hypothetical protein
MGEIKLTFLRTKPLYFALSSDRKDGPKKVIEVWVFDPSHRARDDRLASRTLL